MTAIFEAMDFLTSCDEYSVEASIEVRDEGGFECQLSWEKGVDEKLWGIIASNKGELLPVTHEQWRHGSFIFAAAPEEVHTRVHEIFAQFTLEPFGYWYSVGNDTLCFHSFRPEVATVFLERAEPGAFNEDEPSTQFGDALRQSPLVVESVFQQGQFTIKLAPGGIATPATTFRELADLYAP